MQAPRSPSRASTLASQDNISSPQNAALLGATTAFGRPTSRAKGPANLHNGNNTALAAASLVGSRNTTPSPQHGVGKSPAPLLFPNWTGGSAQGGKSYGGQDRSSLIAGSVPNLGPPQQPHRGHAKSPSQQAAFLAASRAPPPSNISLETGSARPRAQTSRTPAVAPKPRRLSSHTSQIQDSDDEKPTDSTPIPPTTSLVKLFERKSSASLPSGQRPEPILIKPSSDLTIKSPKPVRTSGGITSMFKMEVEKADRVRSSPQRNTPGTSNLPSLAATRTLSNDSYASAQEDLATPSPRLSAATKPPLSPGSSNIQKSDATRTDLAPPLRRSSTSGAIAIPQGRPGNSSSPPETYSPSTASVKSISAQYRQLYPRKVTPSMTGDQLANAMVAGSLASSRAPSPQKEQPPPPPSRRGKHKSAWSFSRTPSPTKTGMRHTMREPESEGSEDEDEDRLHPYGKHKKKRLVRKHPNKHHEGDRKRWRDAVSERERKRYEGVWAANKSIYCSFTVEEEVMFSAATSLQRRTDAEETMADQVSNILVRDIWNRSRLPENTLETVWDLVDRDNSGRLGKEEFVVGMWLIDQRLKGRKLPVKVSDSVWASVKGLQGIKIRKSY